MQTFPQIFVVRLKTSSCSQMCSFHHVWTLLTRLPGSPGSPFSPFWPPDEPCDDNNNNMAVKNRGVSALWLTAELWTFFNVQHFTNRLHIFHEDVYRWSRYSQEVLDNLDHHGGLEVPDHPAEETHTKKQKISVFKASMKQSDFMKFASGCSCRITDLESDEVHNCS